MKKDERVYCTDCMYLSFDVCEGTDEDGDLDLIPSCVYESVCDLSDCEDSRSYADRPYYEPIARSMEDGIRLDVFCGGYPIRIVY